MELGLAMGEGAESSFGDRAETGLLLSNKVVVVVVVSPTKCIY